jgi:hypothetical protein
MVKKDKQPKELTGQDLAVLNTNKTGRPSFEWTPAMEEEILAGIVAGKAIRQVVLEGSEALPSVDTIYRRLATDKGFSERYTHAREMQQDTYAEEIVAIADGLHPLFVGKEADEKRLAIETRKWIMGKLRPKKYNDKIIAEITGKDGAPLIPTKNIDVATLTEEQRDALRFAITAIESRDGEVEDIEYNEGEDNE